MGNHKRPELVKRVARIHGHIHAVKEMLDEGRPYDEVVHQITAVRAALDGVNQLILDDLIEDCVAKMNKNEPFEESIVQLQAVVSKMRK
jgi:CsoR family transcriptional regulator, copper-sensing transcriptional repressor